jgi:mycoredoxin
MSSEPTAPDLEVDAVDVYWRPGCGYCGRLLRVFEQAQVTMRLHNIWEDEGARRFVQEHNGGNETVPTVAVGEDVQTNPSPRPFVEQLSQDHPSLVGAELPPPRWARWPRLGA